MNAEDDTRHVAVFRVAHDHPALPGHFPGNPIVPGVVILDQVIGAAERWLGGPLRVTALPAAKFLAPLLPDVEARIELQRRDSTVAFVVLDGETTLARGSLATAAADRA
jgi:3-hydroxymyristoyl/3-hydroxydecanoyl-(acyl carrier protein) dehydratase